MAAELSVNATIDNQMAGVLELRSHTLSAGAVWVQAPPSQVQGNSAPHFSAAVAGAASLSGTVVYLPQGSNTELTLTFTVDGADNAANASYPMMGPTVGAQISQGANASASFTYAR